MSFLIVCCIGPAPGITARPVLVCEVHPELGCGYDYQLGLARELRENRASRFHSCHACTQNLEGITFLKTPGTDKSMDGSDGSSNTLRKEVFTSLFSRKSTLSDTDQRLQAFCTDSETQNSWDVNSFKVREAQSEGKSTNHINTNKTCIHGNTATRSEDCQREIITNSVLTSAGIHVTLTDYDAEFDTRSASTTDKLSEGKQDSQTTLITDRLIGDQPASKHHIEEPESNSTIDRLIASVTVRASPTDQLEPLGRLSDTGSEDEDERNLSSGCLTPSSGGETSSNLSVAEVERSHDARSDRGSTTSSLSTVIKRALSDKRHAHRSRTSLEEEDNSRLYQSDSYLPALRLQLDNQSPQDTPGHHHLARFTLPRPAGKSSVSFLNPPHTEARISRDQEPKHSGNSCESSPTNQSTDLEESVELKTSPPISPLTKGLHCSSLSMYLPPPSISSLNKMWHHSYSGDSLSSDKRGPDAGKLGAELSPHYDLAAKVILLGDYSVGKTSFLSTLSK